MSSSRKHEAINLLKLYSTVNKTQWNAYLTKCHRNHNVRELATMLYRVQAGMALLAKKKLNHEEIDLWFVRIVRSLDKTLKKIWREKHPNPLYNPAIAREHLHRIGEKRMLDIEYEKWVRRQMF